MEEKVFGLPAGLLANSMIVILVAISIILLFGGLRRFILVKMGTRNIPRRKGQSTLIVMGLMLSSIIVAVSLGIGDTVRYSVRSVVFDSAGNIDEVISGPGKQLFGVEYFSYSEFKKVEKLASTNSNIDGIMPYIEINLPVENVKSEIAESRVQVRGYSSNYSDSFDQIKHINDELVSINTLSTDQVYINTALRDTLNLNKGDVVGVYINLEKKEFEVMDVLESGSIAGANITPTISFEISNLQKLLDKENMITNIAISNSGNQDESLELSDDVTQFLRLNLTNKQVANKFFEILSSNEIPTLIKEEAKSLEQTDSETSEELTRIASDLKDDNFNEEFITSVGDYQLQLIILGALDKAGLQAEAAQLLMMFGDLTTLRVDDSKNNGV
ncbi:MAG: ABC transporter permease, partial [Chloroflexota bacterium]|nr:ABC transporter permease [Chloroflexota bacterium]